MALENTPNLPIAGNNENANPLYFWNSLLTKRFLGWFEFTCPKPIKNLPK